MKKRPNPRSTGSKGTAFYKKNVNQRRAIQYGFMAMMGKRSSF